MDGGGEVNTGGWLPPPGAFGCVCVCAHKKNKNKTNGLIMTGHHTLKYLYRSYKSSTHVTPYLHQWYELWFCLRHVGFWVWLSRCGGKTGRRRDNTCISMHEYNHLS